MGKKWWSGVGAVLLTIFGVVGTLVTIFVVDKHICVDVRTLIIVGTLILFVMGTVIKVAYNIYQNRINQVKVNVIESYSSDTTYIIVTDYSPLYEIDQLVTIFYREDKHIDVLDIGIISFIGDNNENLQIKSLNIYEENRDKYDLLKDGKVEIINKCFVKPFVSKKDCRNLMFE